MHYEALKHNLFTNIVLLKKMDAKGVKFYFIFLRKYHYLKIDTEGVNLLKKYIVSTLDTGNGHRDHAENFMTVYRIVFDWENLKLGKSHSNCEYVIFFTYI